ncbi:MAG: peptidase M14 family protein, partial [Gemmatimonadota bacterium]|nr:peptidase M14 family protein [Gemmatimonadota bacterium]
LQAVARETGVSFAPLETDPGEGAFPVRQQRIGMFQRYYGGNMDEGWTRWLLDDFDFDYTTIMDDEILRGGLHERWDVIILPSDSKTMMVEGRSEDGETPPDYRSGFGEAGVAALDAFVENGGTLVTFAEAGDLPIDEMDLPVRDAVRGMWGNEFWAPGSTLKIEIDNTTPFTWGMPEDALAAYLAGGQVYETVPGGGSADVKRLATYPERDILQSGWLLGEETIAEKAAMVAVEKGAGTVLLIGFRTQHRAQTHGTFKLLFNALVDRPESSPRVF